MPKRVTESDIETARLLLRNHCIAATRRIDEDLEYIRQSLAESADILEQCRPKPQKHTGRQRRKLANRIAGEIVTDITDSIGHLRGREFAVNYIEQRILQLLK